MKNLVLPTIWPVACHTDYIGPKSTFVAIEGQVLNGLAYILLALQKGATKIVVDEKAVNQQLVDLVASFNVELVSVTNTRAALSNLSAKAWGYPANQLKIIGVTGTKGKTTSVYAIRHILAQSGQQVAMLSGVENMIGEHKFVANLTTPQPDYLHMFFAQCVAQKIQYVAMEASAQALSLNRLDDLLFSGVIFTNLELEHSEFYPDINSYFLAKCQIFKLLKQNSFVVLNVDDLWVQKILNQQAIFFKQDLNIKLLKFCTNKLSCSQDYYLDLNKQDLLLELKFKLIRQNKTELACVSNKIFGSYNAYNLAGVSLAVLQLGIDPIKTEMAITTFGGAPGRLEIYKLPNGARGVVDYAHTPSSFENVLNLLRSSTSHLIVIFGAGGGRDPLKRPLMGEIAQKFGDLVILTNDNPRSEEPNAIIRQIIGNQNSDSFIIELDRAKAIKLAYQLSSPNSVIVLLGKGPDEYQIIGKQKLFFSDREQLLSCA